jgi:Family of unknown function (DUF5681)
MGRLRGFGFNRGCAFFCASLNATRENLCDRPKPSGRVQGTITPVIEGTMEDSRKEYAVGYKRPPRSGQFKKGQSGNPGGRRKITGPVQVDAATIFNEVFRVNVGGRTQDMSAKEVEIRQILKKALEKTDFRSMAHLLSLFEKHSCVPVPKTSGVLTLPTSKMPVRMAFLIAEKYGRPEHWTKKQIAWGRKQFEATMTDLERECEAAGIIP